MLEPLKSTRKEDVEKKLKTKLTTLEEEGKKNEEKMLKEIADLKKKLAEASNNPESVEDIQEKGWRKAMREGGRATRTLQKELHYSTSIVDGREIHPHYSRILPDLEIWQPRPTTLNLEWTYSGDWVKVPKIQEQPGGPDYHLYRVARLEKYVDYSGELRSAVAYGDEADKLSI